jgi:hypothetical protein
MVGAVKLQWPSEVWITGLASTEQVQLHPNQLRGVGTSRVLWMHRCNILAFPLRLMTVQPICFTFKE